MMPSLRKDLAE